MSTYAELVAKIKGKPSKATLRVKCGVVTLKAKDTFVTDLTPSKVLNAVVKAENVSFLGSPPEGQDEGQRQTATFTGEQVKGLLGSHFGIATSESNPRNNRREAPVNGEAVAPAGV